MRLLPAPPPPQDLGRTPLATTVTVHQSSSEEVPVPATVLFVCQHGAGKSRMAAAWFNTDPPPGWRATSAGVEPQTSVSLHAPRLLAGTVAEATLDRTRPSRPAVRGGIDTALIAAGVIAAAVLAVSAISTDPETTPAAATSCEVRQRTEKFPAGGGGHPAKDFFGPDETAPMDDFGHVLGDGQIIVLYAPTLSGDEVSRLRSYVAGPSGRGVLGGAVADQTEPVKVVTRNKTLACSSFDLPAVQKFANDWLNDPNNRGN
jgi:hypothetical protein